MIATNYGLLIQGEPFYFLFTITVGNEDSHSPFYKGNQEAEITCQEPRTKAAATL